MDPERSSFRPSVEKLQGGWDAFDSYASARGAPPTAMIIGVRGRAALADGAEGFYFFDPNSIAADNDGTILQPTGTPGPVPGRWKRISNNVVYVSHFGESTARIQAAFTHAADLGKPVKVVFSPGRAYTVDTTIDATLPHGSVIDASGARITCTANTVAFKLNQNANPSNPPGTLRTNITWCGGHLLCAASNPTSASAGIECYNIRDLTIERVKIESFWYGIKFAGADTYNFKALHLRLCHVGFLLDNWSDQDGGTTISVHWQDCTFAGGGISQGTAAIQAFGRMTNVMISGGSVNGDFDTGFNFRNNFPPLALDNPVAITIEGVHFEQGVGATKYIWFEDAQGGNGYLGINICGNAFHANSPIALKLERCRRVRIDGNRFAQTTTGGGRPFDVDANCTSIYVGGANWLADAAGQALPNCLCNRAELTLAPEVRPLNAVPLTGYDGDSKSSGHATIDMSSGLGANYPLISSGVGTAPKGYWVNIQARDSGSAAATGLVGVRLSKGGVTGNVERQLLLTLTKLPNNVLAGVSGFVPADGNGDINVALFASGTNTLDVWIAVTAIAM
jgi:hypothetical protein